MIFGSVDLNGNAVNTHRDSYLLTNLSVVSVRRPFLGAAILLGGAFASFSAAFFDILYPVEIATIIGLSSAAIIIGYQTGQLKLLSRDLRGSELSGVIWGQYKSLNIIRAKIIQKISSSDFGGAL
tara:strand:- start:1564 stop:1938 length:375 start_codon:yes stop_codon:yes gene_type:complete